MGRSRKQRKQFPCGHRGYGKVCKKCRQEKAQAGKEAMEAAAKQRDRQQWTDSFNSDPINLRKLPRQVVEQARHVISKLNQGTAYHCLDGVRLKCDRSVIRIPLPKDYRLLCDDINGRIVPREVMSHQRYNQIVNNTRR